MIAPSKLPPLLCLLALTTCVFAQQSTHSLLEGVVGVGARVPDSARTAESLGTKRIGSGVVIDGNGLIVTIGYLIVEADSVEVFTVDGERTPAEVVGYDNTSGFGLLRATRPLSVRPLELGDSGRLDERSRVLAVGFGGPEEVRAATVTSIREFAGYWEYLLSNAVFTTPPLTRFAGAALLDERGQLVGIGSLAVNDARRGERLAGNMFVPINELRGVMGDLLADGLPPSPRKPWLGIHTELARGRLFVLRTAPDGPAARAGIKSNDIIVKIADEDVLSAADFYRKLWSLGNAGVEVPLTVLSGSTLQDIIVQSADRYDWLRLTEQR